MIVLDVIFEINIYYFFRLYFYLENVKLFFYKGLGNEFRVSYMFGEGFIIVLYF